MYYKGWNDFELLYLIDEGNHKALNLMYLKYTNFIKLIAISCGFKSYQLDDSIQEGYLVLKGALDSFNPNYGKSFTKYFELILKRRFWRLKSQLDKHEHMYIDMPFLIRDNNKLFENVQYYKTVLTKEEAFIFEQIYYYQRSVKNLAEEMNKKLHYIYKNLRKIREKLLIEIDL